MSLVKSEKEIQLISESCRIVADVLKYIKDYVKVGATTRELDKIVEEFILSRGGQPAFKGYRVKNRTFPASICSSLNEVVVHGIPNDEKLISGDILSVDVGVRKNGYYGDSAYTFEVGEVSAQKKRLLSVTEESLYKGIQQAREGNTVNDIGLAIQEFVEGSGFSVVRELVGHGIGKNLHEEPAIPNYYSPSGKQKLKKGMTIAIEPMVNYGTSAVYEKEDGWTVVTRDHKPSAHFEHTVLITDGEPEILTNRN
ncbi:MAG: type I methionyl aminopeptidase [Ignavibacteriae bacterium]|nr:type I methionyl aminopeptidase [Ignavibacteriota bacterium]MCB9242780.1 type I methionyl aminopeptidase [Ignavibacteriales bacterium]